ncbi:hypothetical protein F2P81_004147 [Scophthalmus maximus]|uniref:Uncharacterized protein n=1 Tax=Scophthalmus maximus TaxID=52904 RepID=A0A6A4TGC0_SCOMX|nr:hypothetical protein F2P81_004147 [Scophthalmus maximus]
MRSPNSRTVQEHVPGKQREIVRCYSNTQIRLALWDDEERPERLPLLLSRTAEWVTLYRSRLSQEMHQGAAGTRRRHALHERKWCERRTQRAESVREEVLKLRSLRRREANGKIEPFVIDFHVDPFERLCVLIRCPYQASSTNRF